MQIRRGYLLPPIGDRGHNLSDRNRVDDVGLTISVLSHLTHVPFRSQVLRNLKATIHDGAR
ncbi:hypothetical protein D3C81_2328200 [compost metagenome]